MTVRRIVPNVFEDDPAATRAFWEEVFELDVAMDMGWIATLVSTDERAAQISVFERDGEEGRDPFVSVEVGDVDAVHARVRERATRSSIRSATRSGASGASCCATRPAAW